MPLVNFKQVQQRSNTVESGVGPPDVRVINHLDTTIYRLGTGISDHLRGRECSSSLKIPRSAKLRNVLCGTGILECLGFCSHYSEHTLGVPLLNTET